MDNAGNYTSVVYPDDCDDNSYYTLRFTNGSVFGILDDFNPRYKTLHLGKYIAYPDNRFEYVDLPPMEAEDMLFIVKMVLYTQIISVR